MLEGGVEPRYPTIPGRMKAKKVADRGAPADRREPAGAGAGAAHAAAGRSPAKCEVLGEGPEAAAAVVDLLEKLGVRPMILVLVETDDAGAIEGLARDAHASPATSPPRAAASRSTRWSSATARDAASSSSSAAYGVRDVHHADGDAFASYAGGRLGGRGRGRARRGRRRSW